jgi:hypothetical protein
MGQQWDEFVDSDPAYVDYTWLTVTAWGRRT